MAAESSPRMTSLIKHSKWRRDLLKGCIYVHIMNHFGTQKAKDFYCTFKVFLMRVTIINKNTHGKYFHVHESVKNAWPVYVSYILLSF